MQQKVRDRFACVPRTQKCKTKLDSRYQEYAIYLEKKLKFFHSVANSLDSEEGITASDRV